MKLLSFGISAVAACVLPGTSSAFVINNNDGKEFCSGVKLGSRSSAIYNARVDSADAVSEALKISR